MTQPTRPVEPRPAWLTRCIGTLKRIFQAPIAADHPGEAAPSTKAETPDSRNVPVPASLRQRLKDHPEHLNRLQGVLNEVASGSQSVVPGFQLAVWALEGRLGSFLTEARNDLDTARAGADPEALARAEANVLLMSRIRLKQVWVGDAALNDYFREREEMQRE